MLFKSTRVSFRCGKSCRLRWANHLGPNLKKGSFTSEEERLIIQLHAKMGNKWARMAAHVKLLKASEFGATTITHLSPCSSDYALQCLHCIDSDTFFITNP